MTHRGHMDKTILVNSHIHEGAEGRNVGDRPFEDHSRGKVGNLLHPLFEGGGVEIRARITARLVQFTEDVADGGFAEGISGEVCGVELVQDAGVADELFYPYPAADGG